MPQNIPQHLLPYETAARIYCSKANIDPDEMIQARHPLGLAVPFAVPAWCSEAERLIDLSMMLTSMREAHNAQPQTIITN